MRLRRTSVVQARARSLHQLHHPAEGAIAQTLARLTPRRPRARPARNEVLLIAAPPLRERISELAQSHHFNVHTPETGLAAIQTLERHGHQIACAVISSDPPWGLGLRRLIADEHPGIEIITLVC